MDINADPADPAVWDMIERLRDLKNQANFAGQLGREGGRHGWQPIATSSRAALEECLREIADHFDAHAPTPAIGRGAADGQRVQVHPSPACPTLTMGLARCVTP